MGERCKFRPWCADFSKDTIIWQKGWFLWRDSKSLDNYLKINTLHVVLIFIKIHRNIDEYFDVPKTIENLKQSNRIVLDELLFSKISSSVIFVPQHYLPSKISVARICLVNQNIHLINITRNFKNLFGSSRKNSLLNYRLDLFPIDFCMSLMSYVRAYRAMDPSTLTKSKMWIYEVIRMRCFIKMRLWYKMCVFKGKLSL